jgi:hypothetical protein
MTAVRESNAESVQAALGVALDQGGLKPETLTAALVAASSQDNQNAEIVEMLKKAGAVLPPEVDAEILQSYVGNYKGEQGFEINVTVKDGKLFAGLGGQQLLSLVAVDETTFRPTSFDGYGTLTFNVEAGKTIGCALKHGPNTMQLQRVEGTERP